MQKKRALHYLEEIVLVFLIFLNIFDFFEFLPADLDYVKKIISWTALGYLLYKASLTYIFFNNKHKYVDVALIIAYFMLIFKNVVAFSYGIHEEFVLFHELQSVILEYATSLELLFLILGSAMILLLAVYAAIKIEVKEPSLLGIIHAKGLPKNVQQVVLRIAATYLVFLTFFVVVFNLIMEWLAIAIDAPLVMIGMLGYFYLIFRHYKKYSAEKLIYRIGEFGEAFYEKFVTLFHYRRTIFIGISGMLVLHLVTDALTFIIPYVLVFRDTLYFSQLGAGHTSLIPLFLEQSKNIMIAEKIALAFLYLLNLIGILLLLLLPVLWWYIAAYWKKISIKATTLSIGLTAMAMFFITPLFQISRFNEKSFVGVDIQTGFLFNTFFSSFILAALLAVGIFFFLWFLCKKIKKTMIMVTILSSILFFTYYVYLFATSQFLYYISLIANVASISGKGICLILVENISSISCSAIGADIVFKVAGYLLALHFILFFIITILFYLASFFMCIDELIKEKVFNKIE